MSRPWPFVGRSAEVAAARAAMTDSRSRGVLISGPAGFGKTRLLNAALDGLDDARWACVRVYATPATAESRFGAFRGLVGSTTRSGADPTDVMQAVLHRIDAVAAGRRVVLAVDDAHLLDAYSASFVYSIAMEGAASIAATYRGGEGVPDALSRLRHSDTMTTIRLSPLDGAATTAVLTEALGGPLEPHSAARLHHLTQGNPLLLREIADNTTFESRYGLWHWTTTAAVLEADPAREIEARLARLPAAVREVAEAVALSEPVELSVLLDLAGPDAVDRALVERVIRTVPAGAWIDVHLEHPLYGEILRLRMGGGHQARHRYRALAEAVRDHKPGRRDDPLRTAVWQLRSGTAADPDLLLAAARMAYGQFDLRLTEELAEAALRNGAGFDAIEALAAARGFGGDPEQALAGLQAVRPTLTTNDERTRAAQIEGVIRHLRLHQPTAAALLREATSTVPIEETQVALPMAAAMDFWCGAYTQATSRSAELAADVRLSTAARSIATSMAAAGEAYAGRGEAPTTEPTAERTAEGTAEPTADAVGWLELPYVRSAAAFGRWSATVVTGRAALVLAGETRPSARYFPLYDTVVALTRAMGLRMSGEVRAAYTASLEAHALSEADQGMYVSVCLAERAQTAALLGLADDAATSLAAADAHSLPTTVASYPWVELARAQVAASSSVGPSDSALGPGSHPGAAAAVPILDALLARLRTDGFHGIEIHALLASARFGRIDRTDVDRLRDLRERIPGPLPIAVHDHARGLLEADVAALLQAAAHYERLALNLYTTEAVAQALTLNRTARASGTGALASRLAELLDGRDTIHTPALAIAPRRLSAVQTAVARLAASGRTDSMIAEALHYGSRHVSNTLADVYRLLGASGRSDLAGLLKLNDLLSAPGARDGFGGLDGLDAIGRSG